VKRLNTSLAFTPSYITIIIVKKTPSRATMRAFLKPIHYLIKVLTIIPHQIKTRNVPRLKKCKEWMELAMELEEGEEFSAG
jgi:hypothetical protein